MIECKNLSVESILRSISFRLNKGEITVIIGKNGSGKTTLLRSLSKSLLYKGEIRIDGKDMADYSQKELSRLIAVMPQNLPTPDVSLRKLVSFGRQPYTGFSGRLSDDDNNVVESAIEAVGLSDIVDRNIALLSGGERRLAYFAMMLSQSTPILFCDEPTANLDIEHQKSILSLLSEQKLHTKTVVCVLHDINQAIAIADRILLIDKGALTFDGSPDELVKNKIPEEHFGLMLGNNYG